MDQISRLNDHQILLEKTEYQESHEQLYKNTKTQGGLAAVSLYHYCLATQLQYIFKWIHPHQLESLTF